MQLLIFLITAMQPWFVPFVDPGDDNNYFSYQGTAVFTISLLQYIVLALLYSRGARIYSIGIFSSLRAHPVRYLAPFSDSAGTKDEFFYTRTCIIFTVYVLAIRFANEPSASVIFCARENKWR